MPENKLVENESKKEDKKNRKIQFVRSFRFSHILFIDKFKIANAYIVTEVQVVSFFKKIMPETTMKTKWTQTV